MSAIDESGPAFPLDSNQYGAVLGMSLRDYFAAKAMAAVIMNPETQRELANMGRDEGMVRRDEGMVVISKVAYMQADAMLAERSQP
ncbi:hypothetical protein [Pseudomonas fluorescens group sp. PF-69]